MQVRASIKRRCAGCKLIKRRRHLYIICQTKPSHKQKQG